MARRFKVGNTFYVPMFHFSENPFNEGCAFPIRVCSEKIGWPVQGTVVEQAPPSWFSMKVAHMAKMNGIGVPLFKSRRKCEMFLKLQDIEINNG